MSMDYMYNPCPPPWSSYPPYSPGWPGPYPYMPEPTPYPTPGPVPRPPYGDHRQLLAQAMDIFMRNESLIKQMHEELHEIMGKEELAENAKFQNMMMHFMEMCNYGNKTAGYIAALLCKERSGAMPPADYYYSPDWYYYPPTSPRDDSRICVDEMMRNYARPMDEHHKAVKSDIEQLKNERQFAQNRDFMEFTNLFEQHDALHLQLMNVLHQLATMQGPNAYPSSSAPY